MLLVAPLVVLLLASTVHGRDTYTVCGGLGPFATKAGQHLTYSERCTPFVEKLRYYKFNSPSSISLYENRADCDDDDELQTTTLKEGECVSVLPTTSHLPLYIALQEVECFSTYCSVDQDPCNGIGLSLCNTAKPNGTIACATNNVTNTCMNKCRTFDDDACDANERLGCVSRSPCFATPDDYGSIGSGSVSFFIFFFLILLCCVAAGVVAVYYYKTNQPKRVAGPAFVSNLWTTMTAKMSKKEEEAEGADAAAVRASSGAGAGVVASGALAEE